MAKQAYVYSGTDWVPLASEVTNLSDYYTKGETDTNFRTKASTGLVLLNTTSFSGVSSANFPDGTFSATYQNYRILVNMTGTGGTLYGRLRVGGSDNTSSVYQIQRLEASGSSTPSAYNSGNTNLWDDFGNIRTIPRPISADLFQPFEATPTSFSHVVITGTAAVLMSVVGYHSASTSFDSFSIIASSGTITGTMSAYGYAK
jgi:hypothetical protein